MNTLIFALVFAVVAVANVSPNPQVPPSPTDESGPSADRLLVRKKRVLPLIFIAPGLYGAAMSMAGGFGAVAVGGGIAAGVASMTGVAAPAGAAAGAAAAGAGAAGGAGTVGTAVGTSAGTGAKAVLGKVGSTVAANGQTFVTNVGHAVATGSNPLNAVIPAAPKIPLPPGAPQFIGDAAETALAAERQKLINTAGQKAQNKLFGWLHRGENKETADAAVAAAGAVQPVAGATN